MDILGQEGSTVTKAGRCGFLQCYEESGSILRRSGMGTTSKKNADILILVDSQMEQDDKTSLIDLKIIAGGRSQHEFVFQVARTYMLIRSSQHLIAARTGLTIDRNWWVSWLTEQYCSLLRSLKVP